MKMTKYFIQSVFIICLNIYFSHQQMCSFTFPPKLCFLSPKTEETCVFSDKEEVKWGLKTPENGLLEVDFVIDKNCDIDTYTIQLLVIENVNMDQCSNLSESYLMANDLNLHSSEDFYIHNEIDLENICTEIYNKSISTEFSHIFTGCYFMKIIREPENMLPIFTEAKYITTDYEKVLPSVHTEAVYTTNRQDSIFVNFNHPYLTNSNYIHISVFCQTRSCDNLNVMREFFVSPIENTTNQKQYDLHVCRLPFSNEENEIIMPKCKFTNRSDMPFVECSFLNLTRGIYKFNFELVNEPIRCKSGSLWGFCSWSRYTDNITEATLLSSIEYTLTTKDHLVWLGVSSLLLLTIIIICVYLFTSNSKAVIHDVPIIQVDREKTNKVFLLYARDCPEFMEMMKGFRTVLRDIGNFEVLDMYDESQFKELMSENGILKSLLNSKIILILSKCAEIQNSQIHKMRTIYKKEQTCLDNNFLIALRHIQAYSEIATYQKLLVVNLDFDDDEYRHFKFLNPYVRFNLPNNFLLILSDLKEEEQALSGEQEEVFKNTFIEKYEEYEKYCRRNRIHLENILKVKSIA